MSSRIAVPLEPAIETYDWPPRWSFWGVAENFARAHILLTVFDGDPRKWLEFIERDGGDADANDVPFLQMIEERLGANPDFIGDLRRLVREFTEFCGPAPAAS